MDLPEELQVMPSNLRFMELIGLWRSRTKLYRFSLMFCYVTMITLFPKPAFGIGSTDFSVTVKSIAEFFFACTVYVPMAILALKRDAFERLVTELGDIFKSVTIANKSDACYDLIRTQNYKIEKFFNFFKAYCTFAAIGYWIPPVLISHWRYWTTPIDGNLTKSVVFELPMEQEFYGLKIRTDFFHYHIFAGLSMPAYCICAYFSLIKITTNCFMMKYGSLVYRLVAARIGDFKPNCSDLKMVVKLHRQAFRITNMVEDICQAQLALQFFACIMFWCLTMIYISTTIDFNLLNLMSIFWLSLMETFGYSYLGTELSKEAAAVGMAIYDLPWYDHSVELQRYYRLIIQRSQRMTCITGVKMFVVQLTTFASVVQMSYTYCLVLKDALKTI